MLNKILVRVKVFFMYFGELSGQKLQDVAAA